MADEDHIVDLDDFVENVIVNGEVSCFVLLKDLCYQTIVVYLWRFNVRKEIRSDSIEKRNIE